jgi:hypothetical protein
MPLSSRQCHFRERTLSGAHNHSGAHAYIKAHAPLGTKVHYMAHAQCSLHGMLIREHKLILGYTLIQGQGWERQVG